MTCRCWKTFNNLAITIEIFFVIDMIIQDFINIEFCVLIRTDRMLTYYQYETPEFIVVDIVVVELTLRLNRNCS